MENELTQEDIDTLEYFWLDGDLEESITFVDKQEQIKVQLPELWAAWANYKQSIQMMDKAFANLWRFKQ